MKNNIYLLCFLATIFFFKNCTKVSEIPDDTVVSDFVWKGLNAYYLYQDQIEDLSDRRFNSDQQLNNYLKTFTSPSNLFNSLILSSDVKSRLIDDYTTLEEPSIRSEKGFQYKVIIEPGTTDNVLCSVLYHLPNSDARIKGLNRGDFFNAVDGTQLTLANFESLLVNNSSNQLTLTMVNFDGTTVTPNGNFITVDNEILSSPPILKEELIPQNGDNIGYILYNNDFSKTYLNDLNNVILRFKNQSVTKLILDLRYNISGGGFANNIAKLGAMLTEQSADAVFIKEQWNTKAQTWFELNQPDSLTTKFPKNLNSATPINSLNLTDVYIILNGESFSGSSATELLINSLTPYLNVHIVGNQTIGNNTGAITLYNSVDYNFALRNNTHTFALQPIVLTFLNKNDQDYESGFSPSLNLCNNEDILDLGVLGNSSEPILNRLLDYISNGSLGNANCNSDNYDHIFNSISKEPDLGVFIEQILPNTL